MTHAILMTLYLAGALLDYRQLESDAEKAGMKSAYAEAQTGYAAALEAAKASAGAQHPDVGRILNRLGLMMEMQGDLAGAESHYQQSIKILEAPALASPTELATSLELYAGLLGKQGKSTEAEKLRERARPIRARQVREMVSRVPATSDASPAVKIGGVVGAPVLTHKVEPEYSPVAKMVKLQGTVLMRIVIGVDGAPRNVEVQRGIGLGLDEQAAGALLQWKFTPATKEGQPVAVMANVEINFRLM